MSEEERYLTYLQFKELCEKKIAFPIRSGELDQIIREFEGEEDGQ